MPFVPHHRTWAQAYDVYPESAIRDTAEAAHDVLPVATHDDSPFFVPTPPNDLAASPSSGLYSKPFSPYSTITPFQYLFASSPTGFWRPAPSSVSPVYHTSSQSDPCRNSHQRPQKSSLLSLAKYADAALKNVLDPLSPLSSLSSLPSSPSTDGSPLSRFPSESSSSSQSEFLPSQHRQSRTQPTTDRAHPSLRIKAPPVRESRYGTRSKSTRLLATTTACIAPSSRSMHQVEGDTMPDEHNVPSTRHKRRAAEPAPQSKHKRPRFTSETDDESDSRSEPEGSVGPPSYPNRTFPQHIPMNKHFSLFYRRFPVSSYNSDGPTNGLSDAVFNPPTDPLSLYHPRFVKGKGRTKVGLCPCCSEDPTRGGGGTKVWLSLKFSAYKCYHMQFNHGISASTGLPFSPPMEFRIVARAEVGKHEKARMTQGRCHRCKEWVPIEGIKDVPVKVKEIFWWKHAASCHQGSMISGEQDFYVEDDIYQSRLAERDAADGDGENSEDADVDGVHDANTGHDVDNTSNDSAA